MAHREFKDALYGQFARIGQALASPKRIELLDLLAQGEKTVYRPEVHGTVIVLPETPAGSAVKAEKAKRTPADVIARNEAMANAYRNLTRVNYSAIAHCERAAAKARAQLSQNL